MQTGFWTGSPFILCWNVIADSCRPRPMSCWPHTAKELMRSPPKKNEFLECLFINWSILYLRTHDNTSFRQETHSSSNGGMICGSWEEGQALCIVWLSRSRRAATWFPPCGKLAKSCKIIRTSKPKSIKASQWKIRLHRTAIYIHVLRIYMYCHEYKIYILKSYHLATKKPHVARYPSHSAGSILCPHAVCPRPREHTVGIPGGGGMLAGPAKFTRPPPMLKESVPRNSWKKIGECRTIFFDYIFCPGWTYFDVVWSYLFIFFAVVNYFDLLGSYAFILLNYFMIILLSSSTIFCLVPRWPAFTDMYPKWLQQNGRILSLQQKHTKAVCTKWWEIMWDPYKMVLISTLG